MRPRYLIVDGHSIIFTWPELRNLHRRRPSLAREALITQLRDYQDWTGVRVIAVFDGTGSRVTELSNPGDLHIFYSKRGHTADAIIERLTSKYAERFDLSVATADSLERQIVHANGASWISPEMLRQIIAQARMK